MTAAATEDHGGAPGGAPTASSSTDAVSASSATSAPGSAQGANKGSGSAKRPAAKKTPTKSAAANAAKTSTTARPAAKPTAATGKAATPSGAKAAAAKTTVAKTAAVKATAAKSAAAKSSATAAAKKATAAKVQAVKASASDADAAKKAAARSAAAKKAAATRAARAREAARAAEAAAAKESKAALVRAETDSAAPAEVAARTAPTAPVSPATEADAPESHVLPIETVAPTEAVEAVDTVKSVESDVETIEASAPEDAAESVIEAPADEVDARAASETPDEPEPTSEDAPVEDSTEESSTTTILAAPVVADVEGSGGYALEVRGLSKSYGDTRAVEAISLSVPTGAFYGIVGPNGAGKTTTLSIVAGLLRPDSGTVKIAGLDHSTGGAKRILGVLPDRLRTFDRLTGRQLLHYYGLLRGLSADVVEKRTADLARAFDLTGALGRVVSDYSAGMTKKIMLAGAMIHSPRVLILDEPFESVDPVSSGIILDILRAYVAHGGTVVLSSHGMDLVERVCSRIAVIVGGRVLAEGTVDEVRGEQSLEERFTELTRGAGEVEGLEWLHTFSA